MDNKRTYNKGFVTEVEGDDRDGVLKKLRSLRKYWEWADKMKDQYRFYKLQEDKNMKLKNADIIRRDSSMFLAMSLAMINQIIVAFEQEPRIIAVNEVVEAKEKIGINLGKCGDVICNPGKDVFSEKIYQDVLNQPKIQEINTLHVNIGYFIDKKIQELTNRDVFPYAMDKL